MTMRNIIVVLLALMLVVTPAVATCPTTWNDPNLTCIVAQNWHDFVNNLTYQNASTLHLTGGTMTGQINAGGYNLSISAHRSLTAML